MHSLTDLIRDSEAIMSNRVVRLEPDVHPAAGGHVLGWEVAAAVPPDEGRVGSAAVSDLNEIIPVSKIMFTNYIMSCYLLLISNSI